MFGYRVEKVQNSSVEEEVMEKKELLCASFFAGVGGIDLGFEMTHCFKTVYANEFDSYPAATFELNNDSKLQ